jgi:outer membrane protein OmpA-like peptidoglycan-associated protein
MWRGLLAVGLAGLLAGCSMFDGGSSQSKPASTAQSYPNLGTVPPAAPATSTAAERQTIASGLVADQQNAAYSDQQLTAQSEQQGSVPPAAATTITTSATATGDTSGSQAQAPAATTDTQAAASTAAVPVQSTAGASSTAAAATSAAAAPAPAAVQPQRPAAPQPTSGITPLAPPPNPLPEAPAATQMASAPPQGAVSVDQAQLGGAPVREQLYPAPYAPYYGAAAGGAPAYGTAYSGAAPAALPPAGSPIAVVFFEDASSSLSNRAMGVLRDVVLIQQQQGGQIRVVGHASERTAAVTYREHDAINQKLSLARANSVARALIKFGASQGTISISAVGSQQPVYYEFMPTGEAGNRRVEVFLDR